MRCDLTTAIGKPAITNQPSALSERILQSTPKTSEVLKLKKAGSEFESMLLAKWWSAMKDSGLGSEENSSDPGHDTLDEMGIQAMSTAVASRGGLGIGAMLVRSMLSNPREQGGDSPTKATHALKVS